MHTGKEKEERIERQAIERRSNTIYTAIVEEDGRVYIYQKSDTEILVDFFLRRELAESKYFIF